MKLLASSSIAMSIIVAAVLLGGGAAHALDGLPAGDNFPFVIRLDTQYTKEGRNCTGSIIDNGLIVSSTHCVVMNKNIYNTRDVSIVTYDASERKTVLSSIIAHVVPKAYLESNSLENDL